MRSAAVFCAAFLASPALAGEATVIELPSGPVVMSHDRDDFSATLNVAGNQIVLESAYMPNVFGTSGNSALIFLSTGGSLCHGEFTWITSDDEGLRATEPFGTCAESGDLVATDDGPMIVMPRFGAAGTAGFTFTRDEQVIETELGLPTAGIDNPKDADAWIGMVASEVLGAAEMEPTLLGIMSWEQMEDVRIASMVTSEKMEIDGDWVVAGGCRPHLCSDERATVAISRKDGSVLVGHWSDETGGTLYGTPVTAIPNRMRMMMAGR